MTTCAAALAHVLLRNRRAAVPAQNNARR